MRLIMYASLVCSRLAVNESTNLKKMLTALFRTWAYLRDLLLVFYSSTYFYLYIHEKKHIK